jgi:hypothetical protein
MPVSRKHLLLALGLLAAAAAFIAPTGVARADEPDAVMRPGMYEGQWHGDKVRFIIEDVAGDGTFSGIVHFDKTSRFPDYLFLFTGEIGRHRSITINRDPNNDPQVAKAGEPRREKGTLIWHGETTGNDLDQPYPFELRIPLPR